MSANGSRSRTRRKSIERSRRVRPAQLVEEPHAAHDNATAERLSLLADNEAWSRAGEELRRVDPQRYLALLKVAEDICSIHRDPLGEVTAVGFYVFPRSKSDQFD